MNNETWSTKEKSTFHSPCPYGNDECPTCVQKKEKCVCDGTFICSHHKSIKIEKWEDDFKLIFESILCASATGEIEEDDGTRIRTFDTNPLIDHIRTQRSLAQQEILDRVYSELENPSFAAVLESNERRRGYTIAIDEVIDILSTIRNSII